MIRLNNLLKGLMINPSRIYLKQFVKESSHFLPPGSFVLDAGAGHSPYRELFSHMNYEAADFCKLDDPPYVEIDYVCDLTSIPVLDERYDLIICTQVLEHVPDPQAVLLELKRTLKPGCELWISAPFFYKEHQIPYDFYRYTQFGIRNLLQLAGFQIKRFEKLEGYYATLAYQLHLAAVNLPVSWKQYGGGFLGLCVSMGVLLIKPIFFLLALMFSRLDLRSKNTTDGHCKNYAIVALKPHPNQGTNLTSNTPISKI
ncbi:MAG TPA: class I SAM-dependent methyltransferase [Porticoccus sp.]|nr:class I SAM-dependent methyltransferase [Porticoccus sp.]